MKKYIGSPEHIKNAAEARKKAYSKRPCIHCGLETCTGLIKRHEAACLHDDANRRDCKQCGERIFDLKKATFCTRSCAATYNNTVFKKRKAGTSTRVFLCTNCGVSKKQAGGSFGKYCSNACHQDARWEESKRRIISGDLKGVGIVRLKRFLIETRGEQCEDCGQGTTWNGKSLTLEMDHVDGDRGHDHPDNLRLLCPNCHTQTETWGRKKRS